MNKASIKIIAHIIFWLLATIVLTLLLMGVGVAIKLFIKVLFG